MATATRNSPPTTDASRGLVITRVFDAPRELVFRAWTEPGHLAQWWGQPRGATMPVCEVDLRVGGVFRYCVQRADGEAIWGKSVYREIVAPARLAFTVAFTDEKGNAIAPEGLPAESFVTATFTERDGRTTVRIEHAGVERASVENQLNYRLGWGESLDRLAEDIATARDDWRMVITRTCDAPRSLVFAAWTEPARLARWFGPAGFSVPVCEMDLRPGGALRIVMRSPDGVDYPIKGAIVDVKPPERLVMTMDTSEHPAEWHAMLDQARGTPGSGRGLDVHLTVTFEERDRQTLLTIVSRFVTAADRAASFKLGTVQGWSQSLHRLDEVLAQALE